MTSVKEGQILECDSGEQVICVNVRPSAFPYARCKTSWGWAPLGDCVFDVLHADGCCNWGLSPGDFWFYGFTTQDELAPPELIEEYRAAQKEFQAKLRSSAAAAAAALAEEKAELLNNPRYQALARGDDETSGTLAARNIRTELKTAFPGTRFSVRKSSHGSVQVQWLDGPSVMGVDALLSKYNATEPDPYDGMKMRTEQRAWRECFGGVNYLNTTRDYSPTLIRDALDAVYSRYAVEPAARTIDVERYLAGNARLVMLPGAADDLGILIYRDLRQRDATFKAAEPSPSL